MSSLSNEDIAALLKADAAAPKRGGGGRTKKDNTEPREPSTWFKLPHTLQHQGGCDNPDCIDPRPDTNKGRGVCALVQGVYMCRYCFLDSWKSPNAIGKAVEDDSTGDT